MATQNGKSCEHITNAFLNLMDMRFFVDPNAAEVKLIKGALSCLSHFLAIYSPLKMMKNVFFHVKSSFRSQDI